MWSEFIHLSPCTKEKPLKQIEAAIQGKINGEMKPKGLFFSRFCELKLDLALELDLAETDMKLEANDSKNAESKNEASKKKGSTTWLNWCIKEGFFPSSYHSAYQISEDDMKTLNILMVSNEVEEQEFRSKYVISLDPVYDFGIDGNTYIPRRINWAKICQLYDGFYLSQELIDRPLFDLNGHTTDQLVAWKSFDVETLIVWKPNVKLVDVSDLISFSSLWNNFLN